jgi:DNA-directed RNA polymerase specialized sigma24 family protein
MVSEPLCSEEKLKKYRSLVEWRVAQIAGRNHPDYEDICAEALLHCYQSLAKLPESEREEAEAFIVHGARWNTTRYLRSPQNSARSFTADGNPLPVRDPLWVKDENGEWEPNPHYLTAHVPDFAPQLIEKLFRETIKEKIISGLDAKERRFIEAYLKSDTYTEAAYLVDVTPQTMERYVKRLLDRWRVEEFGLPRLYDRNKAPEIVPGEKLLLSPEDADLRYSKTWMKDKNGRIYCRNKDSGNGYSFLHLIISSRTYGILPKSESILFRNNDYTDCRRSNIYNIKRSLNVAEIQKKIRNQKRYKLYMNQNQEYRDNRNRKLREKYAEKKQREREKEGLAG